MAGFYALADPNEPFNLDLDNELEGETLTSCIDPPDRETDFQVPIDAKTQISDHWWEAASIRLTGNGKSRVLGCQ